MHCKDVNTPSSFASVAAYQPVPSTVGNYFQSLFLPIPSTQGICLSFGDGTAPDRLQIAALAIGAAPYHIQTETLATSARTGTTAEPSDRYSLTASL
jgi:hypothetical protein